MAFTWSFLPLKGSDFTTLSNEVAKLPSQTKEEKLKKATLQWALDESQWQSSNGHPEEMAPLLGDIEVSLGAQMGQALKAPANLFPTIPTWDTNPVATEDMAAAQKWIAAGISRDPAAMMNQPTGVADYNNKLTPEALVLAELLCHPQSPLAGDDKIIPLMFHLFETIYLNHPPGGKLLGDFGHSPNMTEMYLFIKTVYPSLILPSRKIAWEASLQANTDVIMSRRAEIFRAGMPGTTYPNSDVKYISALAYASAIFNRPDYLASAQAGEKLISTAIYPDGGWTYIGEQNDSYTYHEIDVTETARYALFSGDETAKKNLEASRWYLPLSIEPSGVAEYSMAPSWKHYWNQIKAPAPAMILAYLLNDPLNLTVSKIEVPKGDLILASFYREDLQPAPWPDHYIVYDRNIEGPRGRFGTFSFSATTRAMPHEDRGKSTYVGCMKAYPPDKLPPGISPTYALDVALDIAGSEVVLPSTHGAVALSREETNAATVGRNLAAISTRYRVAPYHGPALDWTGEQAWLFTPRRLVGLVSVASDKDQEVSGANGFINFLWDKPSKMATPQFEQPSTDVFQLGGLTTQIHETDYGRVAMVYTNDRNAIASLHLIDPKNQDESGSGSIPYAKGESHYYLAEIYPDTSSPAEAVTRLKIENGLIGFDVDEGTHHYRLVFNPTDADQIYHGTLGWNSAPVWLHRSGEQYRPAWIGADGREELVQPPAKLDLAGGTFTIPVPAGSHVVLSDED